jgi:hypothetical protein
LWFFLGLSGKCWDSTASFHILSNSLFVNHPVIYVI